MKLESIVLIFFLALNLGYIREIYAADAQPSVKSFDFSFDDFKVVTDEEKPKKQEVELKKEDQTKLKSSLDDFFKKSAEQIENLKQNIGISPKEKQKRKAAVRTKLNKNLSPSEKAPNPLFYDSEYYEAPKFYTYSYVYTDKTNKDNLHIPKMRYYNRMGELFSLTKSLTKKGQFYNLYNTTRRDQNFNINAQDEFGNTLLLTALRNGNFEIFSFLLEQDADPNLCNDNTICPIQLAVYSNNLDILRALIAKKADIMVEDGNGLTPIKHSMLEKQDLIFEELLKRYLRLPKNRQERIELIEFAENASIENYAQKMRQVFNLENAP